MEKLKALFGMGGAEGSYELEPDARRGPVMDLLRAHGAVGYAGEALAALEAMRPLHTPTLSTDAGAVRSISERRATLARERGYPVYGIDELTANLEKASEARVVIHDVKDDKNLYLIVTDEETRDLFGIITVDKLLKWRQDD